jgi:hypothetical protein
MTSKGQLDEIAESTKIWHYTSCPALLSILQKKQLWFTRLDKLEDPWEGRSRRSCKSPIDNAAEDFGRKALVHCWHIAEGESDVMWKVHAPAFGVAVQSTVGRLKQAFRGREEVLCTPVRYGTDYNPEPPLRRGLQKMKHFEDEREFRAHIDHEYTYDTSNRMLEVPEDGRYVGIDPDTLIEEIWLSPHAPRWFCSVLQNALKLHGYSRDVKCRPTYPA